MGYNRADARHFSSWKKGGNARLHLRFVSIKHSDHEANKDTELHCFSYFFILAAYLPYIKGSFHVLLYTSLHADSHGPINSLAEMDSTQYLASPAILSAEQQ